MVTSRRLPTDFSHSAAYPVWALEPAHDRAWILHFGSDDYRRASFLDQRALGHRPVSGWMVSRAELNTALDAPPATGRLHWLFHIGHCGSSLASRLLDLVPGILGLREPLPLLTLALGRNDPATSAWLPALLPSLARGFDDTQAVVVKPTSTVTTLADRLLPGTGRACLLWVDLSTWLATMLREQALLASVLDTESLRLTTAEVVPAASSDVERLARAWLLEQLRWQTLARSAAPGRLIDLDFAELLAAPADSSARLAEHYGLGVPADWAQRITDSGLLSRYAKDQTQDFDVHTRRRELQDSARHHDRAMAAGMRWAESALDRLGMPELGERLRPSRSHAG